MSVLLPLLSLIGCGSSWCSTSDEFGVVDATCASKKEAEARAKSEETKAKKVETSESASTFTSTPDPKTKLATVVDSGCIGSASGVARCLAD